MVGQTNTTATCGGVEEAVSPQRVRKRRTFVVRSVSNPTHAFNRPIACYVEGCDSPEQALETVCDGENAKGIGLYRVNYDSQTIEYVTIAATFTVAEMESYFFEGVA